MIGDTHVGPDGTVFEVVWDGGEGLVAPRETKLSSIWVPPAFKRPDKPHDPELPMSAEQIRTTKRAYNKTDPTFWKQSDEPKQPVDKASENIYVIKPLDLD